MQASLTVMLSLLVPGDVADFLCVVLGSDGPRKYRNKSNGDESHISRLQIADSSCPSGATLLFFGPAAFQNLVVTPLRPVLFSRVLVKSRNADGELSLVWQSGVSSLNLNPLDSTEKIDLESWCEKIFGKLAVAARIGQVSLFRPKLSWDMQDFPIKPQYGQKDNESLGTVPPRTNDVRPKYDESERRNRPQGIACCGQSSIDSVRRMPNFEGIFRSFAPGVTRVNVVEAKLAKPRNKMSCEVLSGFVIRSLVTAGICADVSKERGQVPRTLCKTCKSAVYKPFWLKLADSSGATRTAIVRSMAATRLFLGVTAEAAATDMSAATNAADALADLIREQDGFEVLLRSVQIDSFDLLTRKEFNTFRFEEPEFALLPQEGGTVLELLELYV